MRKPVVLITGAGGEIGHGLVARLAGSGASLITLDVHPLDAPLVPLVARVFTGSITDTNLLDRMLAEFEIDLVFHLAALLSTRSEFTPVAAHQVNVEGTLNLLEFSQRQGESHGRAVVFVYPSSIAAYGLASLKAKNAAGRVREEECAAPRDKLTRTAYDAAAFNPSADDIRKVALDAFPGATITYEVDEKRQAIVDSWPADVDDSAARADWGFSPQYDFERAFSDYLIPTIRQRYSSSSHPHA